MADPLAQLTSAGASIWLDGLSRARLVDGSLVRLIRDSHVVGVTTHPRVLRNAINGSGHYDWQIRGLAARGVTAEAALREIATLDAAWACDLLRPIYDASAGVDGRVSLGVDPRIVHDTGKTIVAARRLWWRVDRPNLFVAIPATTASLPSITQCLAEGISVNVTLISSRRRYAQVIDAFIDGVEQAHTGRHDLTRLASLASLSPRPAETKVDLHRASRRRRAVHDAASITNIQWAFRTYDEAFTSDRWYPLARVGARPQRPLWTATAGKDRTEPGPRHVPDLATPAHVDVGRDGAGVDELERIGLTMNQASWAALIESIGQKLAAAKRRGRERDDRTEPHTSARS